MDAPSNVSSSPTSHLSQPARIWAPIGVVGFGTALAMWCVWFITHLPALGIPASISGPMLIGVMLASVITGAGCTPRSQRVVVGLGSGLLAGAINLALLANRLTEVPDGGTAQLKPSAVMIVAGFVGVSAVVGLLGGALATARRDTAGVPASRWLTRFAVLTTISVLPLLTLGGLVTSTGSGLAVPDWPGTYESNMFLYPISLMAEPRIYLEHTHRLFGTLVGMTTIGLLLFAILADRRRWIWALAGVLLLAVIAQGLMGAGRVVEQSRWLGVFHGVFGQVFFAATAAYAALLTPAFGLARVQERDDGSADPSPWAVRPVSVKMRLLAGLSLASLLLQLTFGAMYRHLHAPHALWSHVGFSIVVVILTAAIAGVMSARSRQAAEPISPESRRLNARLGLLGKWTFGVMGVQFVLGFVVLWLVLTADPASKMVPTAEQLEAAPPIEAGRSLLRTIHQANGAALLALATLGAVWVLRLAGVSKAPRGGGFHG